MAELYLSTGEVARMVGVPIYTLINAHLHRDLAEPMRISNRRFYAPEDAERARRFFVENPHRSLMK